MALAALGTASNPPAPATRHRGPREGPAWGHREQRGPCPGVAVAPCPWGHVGHRIDLVALPESTEKLILPHLTWNLPSREWDKAEGWLRGEGFTRPQGHRVPVTPWMAAKDPWGHLSLRPDEAVTPPGCSGTFWPPWVLVLGAVGDAAPSPAPPAVARLRRRRGTARRICSTNE